MDESNAGKADLSALKIDRNRKSAPGRKKRWLHLLWLLLPIVIYFGYRATLNRVAPSVKVRTATARVITGSEAAAELVATGYVVAQVKAAVASKGTGRLRVLNVEEGDSVRANTILGELENDDIMAELDLARAQLKQVRADSVLAWQSLTRYRRLLKDNYTTEEVVEEAEAAYTRAVASVEGAEAGVRGAEVALENTVIRAPFDGTVLTKNADVGEMVAPLAATVSSRGAVVTMADMSSLEVEADVSEANIQKVKVGQPCEIILDAYPDHKYPGHVKKIVPTADRTRATVLTKIAFEEKDDRVLPEMSARVNFLPIVDQPAEKIEPALVVPHEALTTREGKTVVFGIVDNRAQMIVVEIGRRLGSETEIISGLEKGQKVILEPPGGMETGDKVEMSI
nr:efflux RND transporter periplasmic adaptor subunit [candidate division Zixibacteria bacterium]